MPRTNSPNFATHSQTRGAGPAWMMPWPVRPSSVFTSVRIALHAVERSCAVHTGTGRGTDTG
jgi:hypothetical protein